MRTAVEFLIEELYKLAVLSDHLDKDEFIKARTMIYEKAKLIEKDQLGALYLTLLLNTPDITKFDFEEWYNKNTNNENR